jgi:hypothetical protein
VVLNPGRAGIANRTSKEAAAPKIHSFQKFYRRYGRLPALRHNLKVGIGFSSQRSVTPASAAGIVCWRICVIHHHFNLDKLQN